MKIKRNRPEYFYASYQEEWAVMYKYYRSEGMREV